LRADKAAATLERKAKREQEELDAKKLKATQKAMRATKKRERDRENAPARKAATPGKKKRKRVPVFLASRPMTPEGEEKRKRGDTPPWAKREAREALIAVQFAAGAADPAAAFAPPKLTTDNAGALRRRGGARALSGLAFHPSHSPTHPPHSRTRTHAQPRRDPAAIFGQPDRHRRKSSAQW
jgi:hypothetical protein